MEKTINIHNDANISAKGKLNSRHCKPVICLETGEVFTSVTDAAEKAGHSAQNLSTHLTGKRKTYGGKHYCYLSNATENLNAIVSRLRETSQMEEDARKWRAYQAEQEAIRKAEEKRKSDIEKAKEKIERYDKICSRLERRWQDAIANRMKAAEEYESLTGSAYETESEEVVA